MTLPADWYSANSEATGRRESYSSLYFKMLWHIAFLTVFPYRLQVSQMPFVGKSASTSGSVHWLGRSAYTSGSVHLLGWGDWKSILAESFQLCDPEILHGLITEPYQCTSVFTSVLTISLENRRVLTCNECRAWSRTSFSYESVPLPCFLLTYPWTTLYKIIPNLPRTKLHTRTHTYSHVNTRIIGYWDKIK